MTEKPILFSGRLVRAILEGRKIQTRRPVTPRQMPPYPLDPPKNNDVGRRCCRCGFPVPSGTRYVHADWCEKRKAPYGQPGGSLWVRETWVLQENLNDSAELVYRADRFARWFDDAPVGEPFYHPSDWRPAGGWKPSIHMPRWASRINLDVTEVRVERLQSISEEDALAEGCCGAGDEDTFDSARDEFAANWDDHYPGSWETNPWVWAIEFTGGLA